MPYGEHVAPEGYVTLIEVARRLGVAKGAAQRMARDGRLPTFRDPRNKRVRLARLEDVEWLAQPSPVE